MKLEVPKRTKESLREIVRARLAGEIMFSDEVPAQSMGMVFMPVMFGALNPPKELLEQVLGSSEPPESLPEEPPKPLHPGYQDKAGEAPQKPVLGKLPDKAQSDRDWGYLPDEEWEELRAALDRKNQSKIRAWEEATEAWMRALDQDALDNKAVDEAHEKALQEWRESLSKHEEALAERERLREDWEQRSLQVYKEWTQDVGVIFGKMEHTFPRSINGLPMFHQIQILHKEDWERVKVALIREQKRTDELDV